MGKLKKISMSIGALGTAGYIFFTAPSVPYIFQDIQKKSGTEQMAGFPGWHSFREIGKTLYGGLFWYPLNSISDLGSKRQDLLFIVNKESQQIFVYNGDFNLERIAKTSTGADKGKKSKKKYNDDVTPEGKYIAVRSFDKNELESWFGKERAPIYGNGMLLFLGHWFPHIAIHGTNSEVKLGREVSSGCPRVDYQTIEWIVQNAKTGSEMLVQPYGVAPYKVEEGFNFRQYHSPYIKRKEKKK